MDDAGFTGTKLVIPDGKCTHARIYIHSKYSCISNLEAYTRLGVNTHLLFSGPMSYTGLYCASSEYPSPPRFLKVDIPSDQKTKEELFKYTL